MKKLLMVVTALVLFFSLGNTEVQAADTFRIAMITDSGTIDDESFNQGTWEGIVEFAEANSISYKYYKPAEVSDTAYLAAIDLAIAGGAEIVITPGFLFETSVYAAQTANPTVKFILIDGTPHDAAYENFLVADNTLSITFNENESGFLAGYAAVKDGYTKLGFTGGMAVPAVVKFGVGFVAGAYYAAEEMDIDIELGNDTYHYFGDFAPSDEHKNLAASWYVSGTEVIFAAAGGAGSSVMAAATDADTKMIGVDIDQSGQSRTVITSAMKQLGVAVQQGLTGWLAGTFAGGESQVKGAADDGVALPMDTSRFTTFDDTAYNAIYAKIEDGTVNVPSNFAELETFLADSSGYPEQWAIEGTEEPADEASNNTVLYVVLGVAVVAAVGGYVFYSKKK